MARYEQQGQLCVELAALMPVLVIVALIVINLARYVELCTRFDRVSLDAVVACGVSPSGQQSAGTAAAAIQTRIAQAFASEDRVQVSVTHQAVSHFGGETVSFSLVPSLTRYTCEMRFAPWPSSAQIAGVRLGAPASLTHQRSLVVDRFRPGVVM